MSAITTATAPLARARRLPRLARETCVTVAACVGATLPAVVSTVRAIAAGYVPNGDRGIIAIRSYDVFTSNTPLVGQFSASSLVTGRPTHSPGPLLYWLLAPAAHLGGGASLALTMGLLDCAAIAGCVLIARRRGGTGLMVAVAVALALMSRSLPAEIYHDIWNPSVGVIPLTLLIFVCWSAACGDAALLPLAALVASFAAQAELTFLLPSVALMLVAVAGLAASHRRRQRWRWWIAAAVVAVVCWAPPVIDQLGHHPGNFSLIAKAAAADRHEVGATIGWHAVVRAVGIPPWWLRIPSGPFYMLGDVKSSPSAFSDVSAVLLLAALLAASMLGFLRRRLDVAWACLSALVLCACLAEVAAATPSRPILMSSLGYTLWWGAPAGMWAWVAAGWAVAQVPWRLPRPRFAAAIGAAAAVAVGVAVAAAEPPDQDRAEYRPLRTAISRVEAALPARIATVRVSGTGAWTSFDFQAGLAFALRRRGQRPVATWAPKRIGSRYSIAHRWGAAVYAWDGHGPRTSDRVLARIPVAGANDGVVTITLALPVR